MKPVKVTPKLLVALVEVAKVAQLIGLSFKCGTNYTLCCGLARARVESDKIVPKIRLSPKFGACEGGNRKMARGIYSPRTTKNAVWSCRSYRVRECFPSTLSECNGILFKREIILFKAVV